MTKKILMALTLHSAMENTDSKIQSKLEQLCAEVKALIDFLETPGKYKG